MTSEPREAHRESTERGVAYDAIPNRDEEGTVIGASAVIIDAAALQPEAAIVAARRDHETESFYDSAPIGLCVISRALRFVRANRRLAAIDGLDVGAHLGRSVREVLPTVADQFEPVLRKAIDTGTPSSDELVVGAGAATRVWTVDCSPLRDRAGAVLGVTVAVNDVTDARQATASFRELADSMPQIVWSSTADGTVDYRNRRWYDLTRTTPLDEPNPLTFVHPDDRERSSRHWASCVADGSALELEFRLKFPTETEYRWFVARALPVRNAAGDVVRWYGTHTDIHEWKVAQAHLSESRERLRAALDASSTGTFRWNSQTNDLDWDESLDRLLGLPPGHSLGTLEAFVARVHPDDRAAVIAQCERCATEGVDFEMEFRVTRGDGTTRWLTARGRSYVDSDGRPVYMTGACADMTERKAAEGRLAHKRRILEMIAGGAPLSATLEAIVALLETHWPDTIASIMLVDDAGGLRVGAAPGLPPAYAAALDGLSIGPFVGSCGTTAFRREPVIVSDIEHDSLWADYRHLALAHHLRACWSVPIVTSTGRLVGTVAVYSREPRVPHAGQTDFATDAAASLAAIAIEKSLIEHELHEQARALAAANQHKDEFLARLAHELRNPLGAIQAALDLFKLRTEDASLLERSRAVIDRQTNHIVRLVDDLSDLSRIGTGKIELRRQRVDVASIAADAADTVRPLAVSRRQQLVVELPVEPVVVNGDPARLMQICVNLLNNAVKYTQLGGQIRVIVTESTGMASIRVRDNGLGITAAMLPRVFDLYAQADGVSEHAQGGVGIGLHIVQNLVKLHGGSVTATSAGAGLGSEFEVCMPVNSPRST